MANLVVLVGETGSGKSTSFKTLPPEETFILNILDKELPFKGWKKDYNAANKNIGSTQKYSSVLQTIKWVNDNPKIKYLVIDDGGYLMNIEIFEKSKQTGYGKFSEIAYHMYLLLKDIRTNLREDLNVVFTFHQKEEITDGLVPKKTVKLPGKMVEEKFNPIELATVVLFTKVSYDKDGKPIYSFVTGRTKEFELAKSPDGMFPSIEIPNDMKEVFDQIHIYNTQK